MIKKNLNKKSERVKMMAASMCITTTPMRWRESQRSRQKSCELQSTNSKKGKSPDSNGIQSRRHQSTRRWDERNGETNLQRSHKAEWIHAGGMEVCSLPALYELFTTKLYSRLYPRLDQKQAEDQAGFRSSYQTTDHEWRIKMWIATIDFTKAFVSITHKTTWKALKSCNIDHGYISAVSDTISCETGASFFVCANRAGTNCALTIAHNSNTTRAHVARSALESTYSRLDFQCVGFWNVTRSDMSRWVLWYSNVVLLSVQLFCDDACSCSVVLLLRCWMCAAWITLSRVVVHICKQCGRHSHDHQREQYQFATCCENAQS